VTITLIKKKITERWTDLKPKKALVSEDTKKGGKTSAEDGGAYGDLMGMMKEMYENGDDNMKRMIAESWQKNQKK